jgi:hypothetical protein
MQRKLAAYRRVRALFFDAQQLSRREKILAAKCARKSIRENVQEDPLVLANDAISEARQQLQVERSAHALAKSRYSF